LPAANPPSSLTEQTILTLANLNIPPSPQSLARFARLAQDLRPANHIILGISGDFDSAAMEAKTARRVLKHAQRRRLTEDDIQYHPAKPGYYLIPKDDVNQSSIHMVTLASRATIPTTTPSVV